MRLLGFALATFLTLVGCGGPTEPKHPEPSAHAEPGSDDGGGLYHEGGATKEQRERVERAVETVAETQIRITTMVGLALRVMTAVWLVSNERCPTAEELVRTADANPNLRATDTWDNAYEISCGPKGPVVRSAGPDGVMGTKDDIVLSGDE